MESTLRRTWAEIDLDALRYNYRALRDHVGTGVKFLGVVKADAYGHGAVQVSRTLQALGVSGGQLLGGQVFQALTIGVLACLAANLTLREGTVTPATGDVGLLPYAALALSGCTGIVLTFRRKRKDD